MMDKAADGEACQMHCCRYLREEEVSDGAADDDPQRESPETTVESENRRVESAQCKEETGQAHYVLLVCQIVQDEYEHRYSVGSRDFPSLHTGEEGKREPAPHVADKMPYGYMLDRSCEHMCQHVGAWCVVGYGQIDYYQ